MSLLVSPVTSNNQNIVLQTSPPAAQARTAPSRIFIGAEAQFFHEVGQVSDCFKKSSIESTAIDLASHFFLFVTDSFLKSKEHVLPLIAKLADPHFKQRLFPVNIDKTLAIFSPGSEANYVTYWGEILKNTNPQSSEYVQIKAIEENIAPLIRAIRDTLMPPLSELLQQDLKSVIETIEQGSHLLETKRFFFLPQVNTDRVVGHDDNCTRIAALFKTKPVVTIAGHPGMGKTTLAVEYAKRSEAYPTGIFWFEARTEQTLQESYKQLAIQLGITSQSVLSEMERMKECLFIYDNVTEGFTLPRFPFANTLVLGHALQNPDISLEGFSKEEAIEYAEQSALELSRQIKEQNIQIFVSHNSGSVAQVDQMDGIFHQMGIELLRDKRELRSFDNKRESINIAIGQADYTFSIVTDSYIKSLGCLFEINTTLNDPDWRARLFPIVLNTNLDDAAIIGYEIFWQEEAARLENSGGSAAEIATAKEGAQKIGTYLRFVKELELEPFSVQANTQFQKTLAHMLTRQEKLEKKGGYREREPATFDTALKSLNQQFTGEAGTKKEREVGKALIQQAKTLIGHAEAEKIVNLEVAELTLKAGYFLSRTKDLKGALEMFQKALKIYIECLGTEEHICVAITYNNIGIVLKDQGDLKGALGMFENALKIKIAFLGTEEHTSVATSFNNIGLLLKDQGDLKGALEMFQKGLQIDIASLGTEEHTSVATTYNNIGIVLKDQGNLKGALEMFQKALNLYTASLRTEEHTSVAISYNNIGLVLKDQGDLKGALEMLQKGLRITTGYLGTEEHTSVATSYNRIGDVLLLLNQNEQAKEHYAKAKQILQKSVL